MPDPTLFGDDSAPTEPTETLSAGRRRTALQRALIDAGYHPLTKTRTRPELGTCGGCAHRQLLDHHGHSYPKCELATPTHGAATDVRAWWPACAAFEAKP